MKRFLLFDYLFNTSNIYIFLLPVFFVLHACVENSFIPWMAITVIVSKYVLITIILLLAFKPLIGSPNKIYLYTFALLTFQLFFGSSHDFIKTSFPSSFIIRYSVLLPFFLFIFSVLFIYLYNTQRSFNRLTNYLNWFTIFILSLDLGLLGVSSIKNKNVSIRESFMETSGQAVNSPDVYLILADEYAGNQELKELFKFNNNKFLQGLRNRGFHVVENSISNYNHTVYSMASLLNMGYIDNIKPVANNGDIYACRNLIRNSKVFNFFSEKGYAIYNNSFFKILNIQPLVENGVLPSIEDIIEAQSFTSRVRHDIGFNFLSETQISNTINATRNRNIKTVVQTIHDIKIKLNRPKFVYTHLIMPHYPYYYDSVGRLIPTQLITENFKMNRSAYVENLKYSNTVFLRLIDIIRANSKQPPIIIIMSDHGFRQFTTEVDKDYYFMNLNAVFLPNQDYSNFYQRMSNVNQFRILLNTQFKQQFPILKDSTKYLLE